MAVRSRSSATCLCAASRLNAAENPTKLLHITSGHSSASIRVGCINWWPRIPVQNQNNRISMLTRSPKTDQTQTTFSSFCRTSQLFFVSGGGVPSISSLQDPKLDLSFRVGFMRHTSNWRLHFTAFLLTTVQFSCLQGSTSEDNFLGSANFDQSKHPPLMPHTCDSVFKLKQWALCVVYGGHVLCGNYPPVSHTKKSSVCSR